MVHFGTKLGGVGCSTTSTQRDYQPKKIPELSHNNHYISASMQLSSKNQTHEHKAYNTLHLPLFPCGPRFSCIDLAVWSAPCYARDDLLLPAQSKQPNRTQNHRVRNITHVVVFGKNPVPRIEYPRLLKPQHTDRERKAKQEIARLIDLPVFPRLIISKTTGWTIPPSRAP